MTPSPSSRSRDAALRRLARCNRWLLAGSATLTGAFTLLAAQAFPGRTASAATKGADTKVKSSRASDRAAKKQVSTSTDPVKALKAASQAPQAASSSTTTQTTATDPTQTTTTEQTTPTEATTTAESSTVVSGGS
jgi:cytoskeletal protein RodZ